MARINIDVTDFLKQEFKRNCFMNKVSMNKLIQDDIVTRIRKKDFKVKND